MSEAVDRLPCGVVAFHDDGRILRINRTLAEMLHRDPDDLVGTHVETIFPRGGLIFYQTHFYPMVRLHGSIEEIYFEIQPVAEPSIPVLINAVRDESTSPPETVCVIVAVRQRGKFESALLEARRSAEHANQAKAKFLSMISHDLRSPLQSISGFSEALLREYSGPLNEEQRKDVQAIRAGSRDLERLIDDILGFSTLESGAVEIQPEAVSVNESFDRAITLLRLRMSERGVTLTRGDVDPSARVVADPDRLQQILLNLLTNALKFTPAGGSVTLSFESCETEGRILVRDTGRGIEPDKLEEIFQPFSQIDTRKTDPAERGVGLGLAISRELARRMKGDLTATSVPGKGSTFTITLPLADH